MGVKKTEGENKMLITVLRTALLYILLTLFMRLMGKRQIGQLQPAEFVVTMLMSEIIAMPIEDPSLPLLNSLVSVALLAALEILLSVLCMKSERFRKGVQGNAVVVIRKGQLDVDKLRQLRFTLDDVSEALRKKDVFHIEDVEYAIAETDGSLSVLLKAEKQTPTTGDLRLAVKKAELPVTVVADGKKIGSALSGISVSDREIDRLLKQSGVKAEDVLLMTATESGNTQVIRKEKKQ